MIMPKNISEHAYQTIRAALFDSDIYVGQKIFHNELGKKLGISMTPLREALFRLAAEGLLQHEGNKGFSVSPITTDEIRDFYETRELIEPIMAEKAALAPAIEKTSLFSEFYNHCESFMIEPYTRRKMSLDKKFHLGIAQLAGNSVLEKALSQIYDKLVLKSVFKNISFDRGRQIVREHSDIMDALNEKDGKKAAKLMKNHIKRQKKFMFKHIEL